MGKGKDTSTTSTAVEHHSTPLSALRDPSEFGPPPKRAPGTAAPQPTPPLSGGLRSALTTQQLHSQRERSYATQQEEPDAEKLPSGPFKADTTGLSTAHLPPPPKFRGDEDIQAEPVAPKAKPQLPPRLPPRNLSSTLPATPPPAYEPIQQVSGISLNQGAIDRLGREGVSVPGLGIGRQTPPRLPPRAGGVSTAQLESAASASQSQRSEQQDRFGHMRTGSSDAGSGTTWAQKQAALETASNFKKDPSSVSVSDLRDATSTANNFRQRHGEQVASGLKVASSLNQRYGLVDRVASSPSLGSQRVEPQTSPPPLAATATAAHKKPPPPLPPKRQDLSGNPPPIPTSSKPRPM